MELLKSPKIKASTVFLALLLFIFPWLNVQCSGTTVMTQTGLQTLYGGIEMTEQFKEKAEEKAEESPPPAPFALGAALLLILSAVMAVKVFKGEDYNPLITTLTLIAFLLFLAQVIFGFPVTKAVTEMGQSGNQNMPVVFTVEYTFFFWLELLLTGFPYFSRFIPEQSAAVAPQHSEIAEKEDTSAIKEVPAEKQKED